MTKTASSVSARGSRPLLAAGMILLGMAAVSFVDQFIGYLKSEASVWQFLFLRGLIMLAALFVFAFVRRIRLKVVRPGGVALRSLSMSFGLAVYFGALGFVSVATAAAGLFTSPIFVLIIALVFLRQPVGVWRISAVLVGFLGVLMVLNPEAVSLENLRSLSGWAALLPGASDAALTAYLPALGGLFYAIAVVATRQWCADESTMVLLIAYIGALTIFAGVVLAALSVYPAVEFVGPYLGSGWSSPTGSFWFWTLVQSVGSIVGIVALTIGYQTGEASYVAAFEYSALVFSALFTWMLFGTLPARGVSVGILLIIVAGLVLALRARAQPA